MAKYQLLSRGEDKFVWDIKKEQMYKFDEIGGDYVPVKATLMGLHKRGYLVDEGESDEFPAPPTKFEV